MLWSKSYSKPNFHSIKILQKNYKAIAINYLHVENQTWVLMGNKIIYPETLPKIYFKNNF